MSAKEFRSNAPAVLLAKTLQNEDFHSGGPPPKRMKTTFQTTRKSNVGKWLNDEDDKNSYVLNADDLVLIGEMMEELEESISRERV